MPARSTVLRKSELFDAARSHGYMRDMKVPFVVGLRGVVALVAACVLSLAWGCGSSNKPESSPPVETPAGCDAGCDLGVCDPSTSKCVECLTDKDCHSSQTCTDNSCVDEAPVVDLVCKPGSTRCSVDRGAVLTCSSDGSEETSEVCAADAPCTQRGGASALCANWVCSPNSFSCDGDTLLLCSDDGTEQTPFHTCDADQYCDARRALCVDRVCTPGEKSCAGAVLRACNDEGSEQVEELQCSLSEECTPEGCMPLLCVPNATFCNEGKVWKCNGSATSSELVQDCAGADQFCQEHDGEATCSDQVCFPGESVCNNGAATTCKADGSGPKPGGELCADHSEVCFAGQCRDQVCTPGQKLCDHESVYLCADNGSDTTLYKACNYNEFCDPGSGACRTRVCTPGLPTCNGTIKVTCNDDGSGYGSGSLDCADSGKVCESGSCVPKVCEPNSQVCADGGIAHCNYTGSAMGAPYPCYQGTHCENAQCLANVCQPGEPACDGTIVSTCNQEGSGAVPGNAASDCTTQGKVCDDGVCKPQLCKPNSNFCASGNIQRCSSTGASFTLSQYCLSESYCKQLTSTTAECRPKLCVTGATGCLGEDYGTCSSDGVTLEPGFDDCDGAAQVCSMQGCADSAIDDIGGTAEVESLYPGTVVFDRIHVATPRKLTQMAAYLSLPSTRTLRWTVYAPSGYSDWMLIFDQVTTSSGAQFHSSAPMALTLEADKDYLVGVSVSGGSFASYIGPSAGAQILSFGTSSGSGYASFAATIGYYQSNSSSLRAVRLTTALP